MKTVTLICLGLLVGIAVAEENPPVAKTSAHVFAWPFVEWEKMQPRGGTTRGSEVTLVTKARESWKALQLSGLDSKSMDRAAILAMAGSYRVSFDFVETLGFSADYSPPRPYFSWGTEHVAVLANEADFVSLQHCLVMYFKDKEGKTSGPHVMKHWRQDWRYEDETVHAYIGNLTWKNQPSQQPAGRWSQAVYQVDDSPRYEVMGKWTHRGGVSSWVSDESWRPLPRREFSVRDDYSVLAGEHRITIGPTGWIHVQNNRKLAIGKSGGVEKTVGTEIGISRYEAITEPELADGFAAFWEKTGDYWAAVRGEWQRLFSEQKAVTLLGSYDGKKLWAAHFKEAAEIEKAPDADYDFPKMARETISRYLK